MEGLGVIVRPSIGEHLTAAPCVKANLRTLEEVWLTTVPVAAKGCYVDHVAEGSSVLEHLGSAPFV